MTRSLIDLRRLAVLLVACLVCGGGAAPARAEAPSATRRDLAEAYVRFETILATRPLPDSGPERARVHRAFDAATLDFFAGRSVEAIREIDELAASLLPAEERSIGRRLAATLRVRATPRHVAALETPEPDAIAIRVESIYPIEIPEGTDVALELILMRGEARLGEPIPLPLEIDGSGRVSGEVVWRPGPDVEPGRVDVALRSASSAARGAEDGVADTTPVLPPLAAERIAVLPRPLADIRDANRARLQALPRPEPGANAAHVSCWSRSELLTPEPDETSSARFLVDLAALAPDVDAEIDALAAGRDPYAGRPGDVWRTLPTAAGELPLRMYVPTAAAECEPERRLPLVVALHGAGGDENMFFDAYGKGKLVELAESRGFVAVSPRAYGLTWNPAPFADLVDAMIAEQRVDPARVYVIGHSMGAAAASTIARAYPDRVAGVACIAGGSPPTSKDAPRTILIAGGLDPLASAARMRAAVARARQAGANVELRVEPDAGHTLIVGECLADVLDRLSDSP